MSIYPFIFFIALNLYSYSMMHRDKQRAMRKEWRISEKSLLLIAVFGGSIGIWLGMRAPLYHKAAKPLFTVGVPLIFALQLVVVYLWFIR
ncbi:MAG: hypothetical protein RI894_1578 [Bacteroidota bacterium]|jgi:uncharacterized membrane protein YsdA (DUF1294 family)